MHDRELQLYDGTRLIRHDKYDDFISNGWTQDALAASNIHKIHPSFRIVALAEPPTRKFGVARRATVRKVKITKLNLSITQLNRVAIGCHRKC